MKIVVVGLGLLGGSFSLRIREKEKAAHLIGVDTNPENRQKALDLRLVDETMEFDAACKLADLVILATPVSIMIGQLKHALDLIPEKGIIMDLGSTKQKICESVADHPRRQRYVAAHPIAGTEKSGPDAAFSELIRNKMMIFCDKQSSDPVVISFVEAFCKMLDMKIVYMTSEEHDRHIAYVSHLSHLSSFALGLTVLHKEKDERAVFQMAGSGFSSTVRLAKSSSSMWAPIFSQNKENVVRALDDYITQLKVFKNIIENQDEESSTRLMDEANDIRRILMAIDLNK